MIQAVIRLFAISLVTVSLTFIAVFGARFLGSKQTYQDPPHAWFKKSKWRILQALPDEACDTSAMQTLVEKFQADIVALEVKEAHGDWWAVCKEPVKLDEYLKTAASRDWLIRIEARDTQDLDKLIAILSSWDKEMNFGIQARSQKVNRTIRKKGPQWVFAADTATLARLKFFESLWLEPIIEFWPDFVIASTNRKKPEFVDEATSQELKRRLKRVIRLENPDTDVPETTVLEYDGQMGRIF